MGFTNKKMPLQHTQPKSIARYRHQIGVNPENLTFSKDQTVSLTTKLISAISSINPDHKTTTFAVSTLKQSASKRSLFSCKPNSKTKEDGPERVLEVKSSEKFDLITETKVTGNFVEIWYQVEIEDTSYNGVLGQFAPKNESQTLKIRDLQVPSKREFSIIARFLDNRGTILEELKFVISGQKKWPIERRLL